MKINILVPTHDVVQARFAKDLAELVIDIKSTYTESTEVVVTFQAQTHIAKARQDLLKGALEDGSDWALWIDSDMAFPKDTFTRLHRHETAMVGVNGMRRAMPTWPTAMLQTGLDGGEPARLMPHKSQTGLVEVEGMGFGVVLMRLADFKDLWPLTEDPWFLLQYIPHLDRWVGEDAMFCYNVRKNLGIKVMIDQDLSWEIGHIGQLVYGPALLGPGVMS